MIKARYLLTRTMKNKTLVFMAFSWFVICEVGMLHAALIDLGNGVIQNDKGTPSDLSDDSFWIKDLSMFVDMGQTELFLSIASLNNDGSSFLNNSHGDWRLASKSEVDSLGGYGVAEVEGFFLQADGYSDLYSTHIYWYGVMFNDDGYSGGGAYRFISDTGNVTDYWVTTIVVSSLDDRIPGYGAWVIADAVRSVPRSLPWLNLLLDDSRK